MVSKNHSFFNLRNTINKKNYNPLEFYLPRGKKFTLPYTSPNAALNLLRDQLWTPLL
jgi:hypothetical protein